MAWFAAQKEIRVSREAADRLRAQGRIDEALEEYRKLMRVLAEAGLKLRAQAACKLVLDMAPGDVEATATLAALTASKNASNSDITLEVLPADVLLEAPRTPPPLPRDDDIELRRSVFHSSRLFAGLHVDLGDIVIGGLDARVFPAGARLMRAGEVGDGLFAIESGTVDVKGSDAPGGVRPALVGAGTVLGEMSALPENPATGDVVAHTSVVALFLSAKTTTQLAARFPELQARLDKWSVCRRAWHSGLRPDAPMLLAPP